MDNETFWDKAAPKYAKDPISNMDGYNQTLDRMRVLLKSHHKVLEIGCGTGQQPFSWQTEFPATSAPIFHRR